MFLAQVDSLKYTLMDEAEVPKENNAKAAGNWILPNNCRYFKVILLHKQKVYKSPIQSASCQQ
ncbi:hypothetical protein HYC85_008417 [Camellia sinensis]|uniref:Uncharacterized protein n=1 Tax=Camellia sinensis TaxID=4442 RepID=A0A7J7HTH1_CAMSI|nr:hypothetical protein HYC85_008417 [Camellia sinensis]